MTRTTVRGSVAILAILLVGALYWLNAAGFSWYVRAGANAWFQDHREEEKKFASANVGVESFCTLAERPGASVQNETSTDCADPHADHRNTVVVVEYSSTCRRRESEARIEELEADVRTLLSEAEGLRSDRDEARVALKAPRAELARTRATLADVASSLEANKGELNALEALEKEVRAQLAECNGQLKKTREECRQHGDEWLTWATAQQAQLSAAKEELKCAGVKHRQSIETLNARISAARSDNSTLCSQIANLNEAIRRREQEGRQATLAWEARMAQNDREYAGHNRQLGALYVDCRQRKNAVERQLARLQHENDTLRNDLWSLRATVDVMSRENGRLANKVARAQASQHPVESQFSVTLPTVGHFEIRTGTQRRTPSAGRGSAVVYERPTHQRSQRPSVATNSRRPRTRIHIQRRTAARERRRSQR